MKTVLTEVDKAVGISKLSAPSSITRECMTYSRYRLIAAAMYSSYESLWVIMYVS